MVVKLRLCVKTLLVYRCALLLLRYLPAARHAVLEHLCGIFDEYVGYHVVELGEGPGTLCTSLDDVLQEAHDTLSTFVRTNAHAWAPLVSSWSVELMGRLSSKYAGRPGVPPATSLNELLQVWMGCRATRQLLELYVQCLAALGGSSLDACVGALLDTSVLHSPHVDWVVAHIGSSFPDTIISRVLACGLKDFCQYGESIARQDPLYLDKRGAKIGSVVGILGHLAAHHSETIRQELLRLFHDSLNPGRDSHLQVATAPFLLQLASLSPPLLSAVSGELMEALTTPVLQRLQRQLSGLPRDEQENMLGLAVHLLCQMGGASSYRMLQFLVSAASPVSVISSGQHDSITNPRHLPTAVRDTCQKILQLLLLNLHKLVYNRGNSTLPDHSVREIPFLEGLRPRATDICQEMLQQQEQLRRQWLQPLLSLLATHGGSGLAVETVCHALCIADGSDQLSTAISVYAELAASLGPLLPGAVRLAVSRMLCDGAPGALPADRMAQFLFNLACLLRWEKGEGGEILLPVPLSGYITDAMCSHLQALSGLLLHTNPQVVEATVDILSILPFRPASLSIPDLFSVVRAAVALLFSLLHHEQLAPLGRCAQLLSNISLLCPRALKEVLAQLIMGALQPSNAVLFGGVSPSTSKMDAQPDRALLLDLNRKHGSVASFSTGPWAVFHAGIIGRGPKLQLPKGPPVSHRQDLSQWLLSLLVTCCTACGSWTEAVSVSLPPLMVEINPEAARTVAVILVETVCPDVTSSELAWPSEEQARHTVNRDLHIRQQFEQQPFLFRLLSLAAEGRPALCYCSVLLRGLLATLLTHWESCPDGAVSAPAGWPLWASQELVACMGEGQLLPPALGRMYEFFELLVPVELHLLLLTVWKYVQENAPLPQKFSFNQSTGRFCRDFGRDTDPARYLAVVHSVVHKNIDKLELSVAETPPK
uniref:Integrator complex subunit 5 n=1 Tax=Eptatretus burgeri TaxID=7764 RepID=A0A8C4WV32_EPTBU